MRRRAALISAPVVFTHSCRMASARGSVSIGTPNAFATQSAVFPRSYSMAQAPEIAMQLLCGPTQAAASVSQQNRSYAARTTLLP